MVAVVRWRATWAAVVVLLGCRGAALEGANDAREVDGVAEDAADVDTWDEVDSEVVAPDVAEDTSLDGTPEDGDVADSADGTSVEVEDTLDVATDDVETSEVAADVAVDAIDDGDVALEVQDTAVADGISDVPDTAPEIDAETVADSTPTDTQDGTNEVEPEVDADTTSNEVAPDDAADGDTADGTTDVEVADTADVEAADTAETDDTATDTGTETADTDTSVDSADTTLVDTADTTLVDTTPVDTADTTPVDTTPETAADTAVGVEIVDVVVDTAPDVVDTVDVAEVDTTPPGPPVGTVTWTIRTGSDGSLDEAAGIAYCLGPNDCAVPGNALNWDDRAPRSVDVWHVSGEGLTRDEIDRVEIAYPTSDRWAVTCVQVAIDGETIHCAERDVLLGIGLGGLSDWIETPELLCDTCWDAVLTHGPMIGATTDHSARIWLRTDSTRQVDLFVGRDEASLLLVGTGHPAAADDFALTFDVPALAAATTYRYALVIDGQRFPATDTYRFTTAPEAGQPAVFSFAAGSCLRSDIDKVPTQPGFVGLERLAPNFFLFVGDNVYYDPLSNGSIVNTAGARAFLREGLQRTFSWASTLRNARADFGRDARADFSAHTPTWATWDDHDFLHDNSVGMSGGVPDPNRIWARDVFVDYWPNTAYGEGGHGIYHRFAWADVDVFMVDSRYFKDRDRSAIIGPQQRAWLFAGLASSTATFKIVADGSDWSSESIVDSWAGSPVERDALFGHIVAAQIEGVVLVSGDSHRSELRILPGADGSYPIPHVVSSGLATSIRGCPATNEFFEVDHLSSCFGSDTGGAQSFVTLNVDTTLADPEVHIAIRDAAGNTARRLTVKRSALSFRARAELDPRDADFDFDGYADLAIGTPDEDTSAVDDGLVQVLYGSSTHLHTAANRTWTQAQLFGTNEVGDRLGAALAYGDLDGDGDDDLVVAAPGEAIGEAQASGRLNVLRGSPSGLQATAEAYEGTPTAGQHLGQALAVGDFDADGDDDVAVAIPGRGVVQILDGGDGPLVPGMRLSQADVDPNEDEPGDGFGSALATGDFDGDGYADLAIGVPDEDLETDTDTFFGVGAVHVVFGGPLGLQPDGERVVLMSELASIASGLAFGAALVVGDFDCDGLDDLVVGAPQAIGGSGFVVRYFGVDLEFGERLDIGDMSALSPAPNDAFGVALAARDFDGDGLDDLAIGAPGRDGARGVVFVRFADDSAVMLTQDTLNWTVAQVGDHFGAALAAHDFDADGHADLVVAAPDDVVNGIAGAGTVAVVPGRPDGFDAPLEIHGLRMTQRWHQSLNTIGGTGGAEAFDHYGACLAR